MTDVDQSDQACMTALARRTIQDQAPGELVIFGELSREFFRRGIRLDRDGKDVYLGFGVDTAVALMTPIVLEICRRLWESLCERATTAATETAADGAGELLRRMRRRFGPSDAQPPDVTFSDEQLRQVQQVALRHANDLGLPEDQQRLLAGAIVGTLVAQQFPPVG